MNPCETLSRPQVRRLLIATVAASVLSLAAGVGIGSQLAGEATDRAETHAVRGARVEPGVALLELAPPLEPPVAAVRVGPEPGRIQQVSALDFELQGIFGPDRSPGAPTLSLCVGRASARQSFAPNCRAEARPTAGTAGTAAAVLAAADQPPAITSPAEQAAETGRYAHPHRVAASPVEPIASRSVHSRSTPDKPLQGSIASGQFVVQAGVFDSERNARGLLERLRGRGIEGVIVPARQASGQEAFHVVLGRFGSWRDAERARLHLSRDKQIEVFSRRLMPAPTPQIARL